ncbi:MAG: hypothetical protein WCI18_15855 [Pseudomonadota bacterium]
MKIYLQSLCIVWTVFACNSGTLPSITNGSKDDGSLRSEITKLQGEIKIRSAELAKSRNTEDKLTKYLTIDSSRGCFVEQPLKSIEILVDGNLPGPRSLGYGDARKDDGDSSKIAFEFGNDITITSDIGIMKNKGSITSTEFSSKKVADISQISVKKMGTKFFNDRQCHQSCSVFVFCKSSCKTAISELNTFALNSLEIKINGQTFYKNRNIGESFTFGNRNLELGDYKNRAEYLDVLAIQDCAAK